MYKDIRNFSMLQLAAEIFYSSKQEKDTIIISIQEPPEGNGFIFTPTGRVQDVLTLMFEDIDLYKHQNFKEDEVQRYKTFTRSQAVQIISFVKRYENTNISNIWVHCHAGVSRSGAVATVLQTYYNLPVLEKDLVVINYHVALLLAEQLQINIRPQLDFALEQIDQSDTNDILLS